VAYFIWRKPYMVAGRSTFINSMLEKCGFTNAFHELQDRYPAINIEELSLCKPDYVFLSSEPFPFTENHKEELLPIWPDAKYFFVDGEIFSWYGSRMLKAPDYLNELLGKMSGRN
jgi:iron complex transport system substrate-binding protein